MSGVPQLHYNFNQRKTLADFSPPINYFFSFSIGELGEKNKGKTDGQFFFDRVARTNPPLLLLPVFELIPSLTCLIEPPPILHKTILADIAGQLAHGIESSENLNELWTENDSMWLNNRGTNRFRPRLPIILAREGQDASPSYMRTKLYQLSPTSSNKFELSLIQSPLH